MVCRILLTAFTPARSPRSHSRTWKSPRPGHRPRFDPSRLSDSRKLKESTLVSFTATVWEKPRAKTELLLAREVPSPL